MLYMPLLYSQWSDFGSGNNCVCVKKNPNHTSLNENCVVPCVCLRAIRHMHESCYASVGHHIEPCILSYRSKTYTWNDVILVKRSMIFSLTLCLMAVTSETLELGR